jgi:predicted phage gp36 major capsid-like protein
MIARTVAVMAAACALVGLSGCVETRSSLTSAAERLEHNATAMARDARELPSSEDYPAGYSRDARQLADDAHEFRNTALDRGANDPDTRAAFKRVSRSYLLVRDEAEHSDSHDVRADLKPVTDAYLDVEREMGGYPVHRDARADD